jgi:hypothetical protein
MRKTLALAAIALTLALGLGIFAMPQAAVAAEPAAEIIAAPLTALALDQTRETLRSSDGTSHEFEAAPETLKDLKVGDRLEVKRRPETK